MNSSKRDIWNATSSKEWRTAAQVWDVITRQSPKIWTPRVVRRQLRLLLEVGKLEARSTGLVPEGGGNAPREFKRRPGARLRSGFKESR